jgi:hypothetical protein
MGLPPELKALVESADRVADEYGCSVVASTYDGDWVTISFDCKNMPDACFESELRIGKDGLAEWKGGDMSEPWRFSPQGLILFGILYL